MKNKGITQSIFLLSAVLIGFVSPSAIADPLGQTREILFECPVGEDGCEQSEIKQKAAELNTPAAMYEYVRNTHEYALYHGSRSNTINTFLGRRGSDVDIASVLIAMYRSQGLPARYAVGKVAAPASEVANWLGVKNIELAASIMDDQGIQHVELITEGDRQTIEFEHVWVQVLLPFDDYRGAAAPVVDCISATDRCRWIDLDPSWKQRRFNPQAIDLYGDTGFTGFDYERYYNAIKNNDPEYRDKNPLEIYEEAMLAYLKTQYPGKTLEDVADPGVIIPANDGILPASLPYRVTGTYEAFDSIQAHDDVHDPKWAKTVEFEIKVKITDMGTEAVADVPIALGKFNLSDLSTKRLSFSYGAWNEYQNVAAVRLDNEIVGDPILIGNAVTHTIGGYHFTMNIGDKLSFHGKMDGAPATQSGNTDNIIDVTYDNLTMGGYYLITTGGYTSNWSQVHRSAAKLLKANETYSIVYNPNDPGQGSQPCEIDTGLNCTPYIDTNNNGWDETDVKLLDDMTANDELNGGLLYTAANLYFARFVEQTRRLDSLNHSATLIDGYIGVVSSTYDVEYLGDTAFSIMPGGLLIDIKGAQTNGTWRIKDPDTLDDVTFELMGHIGSSLEHEIWQELTGYDAVSTVRGIQMSLAQTGLVDFLAVLNKSTLANDNSAAQQWAKFGFFSNFNNTNLTGYTYDTTNKLRYGQLGITYGALNKKIRVFYASDQLPTWQDSYGMEVLKKTVDSGTSELRKVLVPVVSWDRNNPNVSFAYRIDCLGKNLSDLYAVSNPWLVTNWNPSRYFLFTHDCPWEVYSGSLYAWPSSHNPTPIGTYPKDSLYAEFAQKFNNYYQDNKDFIDFFDERKGYTESEYVFRRLGPLPFSNARIPSLSIANMRNSVLLNDPVDIEYILPGRMVDTGNNQFLVYLEKKYNNGKLFSQSYSISNVFVGSAGGGYVDGTMALQAAQSVPGTSNVLPTFNNTLFTDQNLIAQTNNDLIRTPSTADPISTVTGNMYHDETDFTIKGRGLDYVFTRSYNSAPARTGKNGPFGHGWTHSYNMSLRSNDYGECPNCPKGSGQGQRPENDNGKTSSISYTDERGGEHLYLIDEQTQAITLPPGEFDELLLNTPSEGQHSLVFGNGTRYVFEETGTPGMITVPERTARLKTIEDPYGNRLTMTYDGSGRLAAVSDNLGINGRTGLTFTYHGATERVHTVSDWTGRTWTYQYDTQDNLKSVRNPLVQLTEYTYHAGTHLLHEMILPQQRNGETVKTAFTYYRNQKAFTNANSYGQGETVDYDLYRQRTRIADAGGFSREHYYDTEHGALIKLKEPDGAVLQFKNTADGLRYEKTDGLGYRTQYSYRSDRTIGGTATDQQGRVSRERDALNQDIDYAYGPFEQLSGVIDKRGHEVAVSHYDTTAGCGVAGKPNEFRIAELNGASNVLLRSYCWNADGTLASQTDYLDPDDTNRQRVTTYQYETGSAGLNVAEIQISGSGETQRTTFTYDSLGRIVTETRHRRTSATDATPIELTTAFGYDTLGRLVKVTDPMGTIRETVYDANGQVTQEKTWYPSGTAKAGCAAPASVQGTVYVICTDATHQYDAADRRIATTDVFGNIARYHYDPRGNLIESTDANGKITRYEYDSMNRRKAVIDANGHRTETRYNLRGEAISINNANGETVKSENDAIGRLTKVINPLGFETQYQYDANGNQTCMIDANEHQDSQDPAYQPLNDDGCSESRQYDELNRLVQSKDAQNHITAFAYDLLGNRTEVTDAEWRTTTFRYDDLGRLIEKIDPLIETPDRTETYVYDETDNLIEAVDRAGQTVRHSYDALNRLIRSDYLADDSTETRTYDAFGDLIETGNGAVTYTYAYDAQHRLLGKTDSRLNKTLSWTYDAAGNIDTKTDYQGDITAYQYDSTNRLVAESNPHYLQVSYHYDGAGRLINRILSNGAVTHYEWDEAGRLNRLKNTTGTGNVVNDTTYTRDHLGHILSQTETVGPNPGVTTFSYDPNYRLLTADYPGTAHDEVFSYDKVGNRMTHTRGSLTPNAATRYYFYNAGNQLRGIRIGSTSGPVESTFIYNHNGQLTRQVGPRERNKTIVWNAQNQPRTINASQFQYDPNGYRIRKTTGEQTQNYYLEGEHLEAIYDGDGRLTAQYLRGAVIDEVVNGYQKDGNNKLVNTTYHHDALQSVLGQSGHEGSVLTAQSYGAFGNVISQTGTGNNRLKYTGREEDSTGLYYYRARYYDPFIGRFISEDPLGFDAGDVNFYAYVGNNPVNNNDPTGLILGRAIKEIAEAAASQAMALRSRAVSDAWRLEQRLYQKTGDTTISPLPSPTQLNELANRGKISGFQGHHINSVNSNPRMASDPKNIKFVTDHLAQHNGNFANPTTGALIDRSAGGTLPPISLRNGREIAGFATAEFLGFTAGVLSGIGAIASALDYFDPLNYVFHSSNVGVGSDIVPSSGMINWNAPNFWTSSSASGGFVLYPNKSNTNMMRGVYSK